MTKTIKRSNLVLPSSGYELDREEMTYVEGGGVERWGFLGLGRRYILNATESRAMVTAFAITGSIFGAAGIVALLVPGGQLLGSLLAIAGIYFGLIATLIGTHMTPRGSIVEFYAGVFVRVRGR